MAKKRAKLESRTNYDYTITISDGNGKSIVFRDLRGYDLEFLDHVFKYDSDNKKRDTNLSFDDVCEILSLLLVKPKLKIGSLTRGIIGEIFDIVRDNILCNYVPKVVWLKYCYGMQNSSFSNLEQMESVPMSKFLAMAEIHKEAVDSISSNNPDVPEIDGN
jgi:hypothetical protein